MQLKGRNIEIKMDGEDVKLLQKELKDLGYTIPKKEYDKSYFGNGT